MTRNSKILQYIPLLIIILAFCDDPPKETNQLEEKVRAGNIALQEKMFSNMVPIKYFKDERPNPPICFAYIFQHHGSIQDNSMSNWSIGGPSITKVDCDSVKDLLTSKEFTEEYRQYLKLKERFEKK